MGQYYKPMILGSLTHVNITNNEFIRLWMDAFSYSNGLKLMEHSYLMNKMVSAFEYQISPEGRNHKSRVVWAGDYADKEHDSDLNSDRNLYQMVEDDTTMLQQPPCYDTTCYRYIVNHTKKLYTDKEKLVSDIHPLPLLIAEGNGRGGGDYRGPDAELCGTWARDTISVEREAPEGFTALLCNFAK